MELERPVLAEVNSMDSYCARDIPQTDQLVCELCNQIFSLSITISVCLHRDIFFAWLSHSALRSVRLYNVNLVNDITKILN